MQPQSGILLPPRTVAELSQKGRKDKREEMLIIVIYYSNVVLYYRSCHLHQTFERERKGMEKMIAAAEKGNSPSSVSQPGELSCLSFLFTLLVELQVLLGRFPLS